MMKRKSEHITKVWDTRLWGLAAILLLAVGSVRAQSNDNEQGSGNDSGQNSGSSTASPVVFIGGNVYGGGNEADVEGDTEVTVGGDNVGTSAAPKGLVSVAGSVYGGGNLGSVGAFNRTAPGTEHSHATNETCIGGKPSSVVSGGTCRVNIKGYAEIGPDNMQMTAAGGPDDLGHVFGASRGEVADPSVDIDIDFRTYVNQTFVTISEYAFIKGSVYGGSENGRVLGDTDVKIQDHCQIGNGWNPTLNSGAGGGVNARYDETLFIDPATADPTQIENSAAQLHECASWPFEAPFEPYDKHGSEHGGSVSATDGHTFYGNVFGGGSGLFAYEKEGGGHGDWLRSAGRVEGNTNVEITGGHILTSVYGGCELTDVGNGISVEEGKGRCFVKMSGGTLGVPRTLAQIAAHPVTCYLFGAGKGDQRVRFNQWTNVGSVVVEINDSISQPIIYGSVFGGGEDGHVLGNVNVHIKKMNDDDPIIGTWGTSYVDGNVFGGGRGFGGDALTAGVVCGNVGIDILGGTMLGSIYGGGRLGSVGTYLVPPTESANSSTAHEKYGTLIPDGKKVTIDEPNWTATEENGGGTHGHVTINISGGTIGNDREYQYFTSSVNTSGMTDEQIETARDTELSSLKTENHIPNTEFEYNSDRGCYMLRHTKGGNVFAGAMGRLYGLDNSTVLPHWVELGKVKSTKLTITGGTIKSCVYGGGELGWTSGTHEDEDGKDVSTEIIISNGTAGENVPIIGSEITNGSNVMYTFGSVFGGGYGSAMEMLTDANSNNTYPKFQAGRVKYSTKVDMSAGTVLASVYGGGELANVGYGFHSYHQDMGEPLLSDLSDGSEAANTYVTVSGGTVGKAPANGVYFGGATMGNVYGGGSGNNTIARCGLVLGNTNVSISGDDTKIYHNVYGGGAYGSVGDYEYETNTNDPNYVGIVKVFGIEKLHTSGTGTANVTITGGTIGYDGKDNGMVFGSSRGDVQGEGTRDDYMAWVNDANVTIGTSASGNTPATGPQVRGSVYGSGENGHTLHNADVKIHGGTIGVDDNTIPGYTVTSNGITYNGAEYPSRGNVYGGGCGTDTYTKDGKKYYNPMAGIVKGNATVTIDDGHVVRSVYGGGSMGSVGTFTNDETTGKPISCIEAAEASGDTPATEETGLCTVTVSGGKIGPSTMAMPNIYGNVFGAGKGEMHDPAQYPNLETSAYFNKTLVTISGTAFVKGSVYGGSESGHVLGDTWVRIQGGQIGCGKDTDAPYSDWTSTSLAPCVSWNYVEDGLAYDPNASSFVDGDWKYADGTTSTEGGATVATDGHTFYGNVFGGGSGYTPYRNENGVSKWVLSAGRVEGNTRVDIAGGHILTNVYGGNECTDVLGSSTVNMSGGTVGVPRTKEEILQNPALGYLFGAGKGDKRVLFNTWTNVASTSVNVTGGKVYGSVYGGGEDGHVLGDAETTIDQASGKTTVIGCDGESGYDGNVFGGGQGSTSALTAGVVGGNIDLKIKKGTMHGSVYGGGRMASVGTFFENPNGEHYGSLHPDEPEKHGNITVSLTGGIVEQHVFGGGMGTTDNAFNTASKLGISRNVTVNLNKDVEADAVGCVVGGNVFGCNNTNTSPQGVATVNIYATQKAGGTNIGDKTKGTYDISAVYGGGNLAAYEPAIAAGGTHVNIWGCGYTSIQQVYGGGNAASTPSTHVDVYETYEIDEVFGGGNGKDAIGKDLQGNDIPNPGANVGYRDYSAYETSNDESNGAATKELRVANYQYGTGDANVTIHGGTVHRVYGGSNTKGNVRISAVTMLEDVTGCEFHVDEAYGGGKSAPMDATSKLEMACIPGLKTAYGGAEAAEIEGDVELTITNGTYDRVFGGNNISGHIKGKITVNIEETGCKPLIIGQLYGGGNQAPYTPTTVAGQADGITMNVRSFTSIGDIYGGGYGESAVVTADTHVNINVCEGQYVNGFTYANNQDVNQFTGEKTITFTEYLRQYNSETGEWDFLYEEDGKTRRTITPEVSVYLPPFTPGKIGAINTVFGGGNAAKVAGSTNVNIGTLSSELFVTPKVKTVNDAEVETTIEERTHEVKGVDIRGNVYGGGNQAEVTGHTNVKIGKEASGS